MHVSGVYKSGLYCSLDDNLSRDSQSSSSSTDYIGNTEWFGLKRSSKHALNHKQHGPPPNKKENTAIYQSLLTQSGGQSLLNQKHLLWSLTKDIQKARDDSFTSWRQLPSGTVCVSWPPSRWLSRDWWWPQSNKSWLKEPDLNTNSSSVQPGPLSHGDPQQYTWLRNQLRTSLKMCGLLVKRPGLYLMAGLSQICSLFLYLLHSLTFADGSRWRLGGQGQATSIQNIYL